MKRNFLKTAVLMLAVISLGACSKGGSSKSKTELLTKAPWKFQQTGIDLDKNGSVDGELPVDDCSKDNTATFAVNGTGTMDEGATKCDPADPQSYSFDWQFLNNETQLEYDGDTFNIYSIDENTLKIYFEDSSTGTTYRILAIFKH